MSTPVRVQQRRTKGWRKPDNTVSVARSSRWGNPFRVSAGTVMGPGWSEVRAAPLGTAHRPLNAYAVYASHAPESGAVDHAVDLFRTFATVTRRDHPAAYEAWIAPLRGKNLMCFCPLEQPCHADVLLAIANPPLCPECRDGKHRNCIGEALADDDTLVPCGCPEHEEARP